MVRTMTFFVVMLVCSVATNGQNIDKIINAKEVERIERVLSSDEMGGRAPFTPGIDKAADFIAGEFKKSGIQPVNGQSYFQDFSFLRLRTVSAAGTIDGTTVDPRNIAVVTTDPEIKIDQTSGFEKIKIGAGDVLYEVVQPLMESDKKILLIVDTAHRQMFNSLKRYRQNTFPHKATIVAVLTSADPSSYSFEYKQTVQQQALKNVVGILPGNKKKDEYVIFSGHYDHLGIRQPNKDGDSIFNGANDDAAGITAVIMLANYFAAKKDNERTLIFAAFTAEESGGYGSTYFSRQYDPAKVMAMFNIEMIGTESKWGTNSAFITGYEKTDMGKILEKNLEKTDFKFYPDPYPTQQLFYRSDNATLARLGVPAHTISTSKMDSEKFYHTQDDEIETLDMKNMAEIIKAIALSSRTIISGKDTPSRVDTKSLN
jgi:Zn-dependent M28 family amino/carboxypeptidase